MTSTRVKQYIFVPADGFQSVYVSLQVPLALAVERVLSNHLMVEVSVLLVAGVLHQAPMSPHRETSLESHLTQLLQETNRRPL